jgi:hypothetical protein
MKHEVKKEGARFSAVPVVPPKLAEVRQKKAARGKKDNRTDREILLSVEGLLLDLHEHLLEKE